MAQIEIEKRRYAVLRHLHDTPGRELNHSTLKVGATAQGIPSTLEEIAIAADWLAKQGLVVIGAAGPIATARLTSHGADVVRGIDEVPGILPHGDPV